MKNLLGFLLLPLLVIIIPITMLSGLASNLFKKGEKNV